MADVRAFKALRFSNKAGGLEDLVAPPYDVIGHAERRDLLARSPHNVVRLILPEGDGSPDSPSSRYAHAGSLLEGWISSGVLAVDEVRSLFVVEEEFELPRSGRGHESASAEGSPAGGQAAMALSRRRKDHSASPCLRRGLLAAMRVEPYGQGRVRPHEGTLSAPKADRLALTRATRSNFSPILTLVPDGDGAVGAELKAASSGRPEEDFVGPDGVRRRLWRITPRPSLSRVESLFSEKDIVIADGHHRYETAVKYMQERSADAGGAGGAAYVLAHIVPAEDEGLAVLPAHRVVSPRRRQDKGKLLERLGVEFDLRKVGREEALVFAATPPGALELPSFAVALGRPLEVFIARLRGGDEMVRRAPGKSSAWRSLDLACLHLLVIEDELGIDSSAIDRGGAVAFGHDASAAMTAAEQEGAIAFIVRPVLPEAVTGVALAGEKMPQKATYFYPKSIAGPVMRLL